VADSTDFTVTAPETPPRKRPKFVPPSVEEVHERLMAGLSTEPFTEILARLVAAEPTPDAVRAWAAKNPDRWAAALTGIARLAGIATASEPTVRIGTLNVLAVSKMSDSALLKAIAERMIEAPRVLSVEAAGVEGGITKQGNRSSGGDGG